MATRVSVTAALGGVRSSDNLDASTKQEMEGPDDGGFRGLPARARWLIAAVMVAAVGAAAALTLTGVEPPLEPWLLVVLGVACATASLVEVFAPGSYPLQPNVVFFAWGAVALPVWALVVLATICFAPPVLIRGARWYKTAFNWGDYVLAGSAAHAITRASGFRRPRRWTGGSRYCCAWARWRSSW